jgi:S-adenosylmethionine hydrolase
MPIISFTSDIGDKDYLPGAIKGKIASNIPEAQIIDITHHLPTFHSAQCAYLCKSAFLHYPPGSIHLVLANVFDSKNAKLVLVKHNEQWIITSNNGLLPMMLNEDPAYCADLSQNIPSPSNIMDLTDQFVDAAKKILLGKPLQDIGPNISLVKNPDLAPQIGENWIEGQIIFIDRFENVVANIPKSLFEEQRNGRSFSIVFKRDEVIDSISDSYADVAPGQKLALFNAAGYLEIAVNRGNAAGLFGLQGYADNQYLSNRVFYQTIRVYFQ